MLDVTEIRAQSHYAIHDKLVLLSDSQTTLFSCDFLVSRHMMRYVIGEYKQCTQNSDCNDPSEQKCVDKICRCPIGTVLHYGKCTASLSK